MNILSRVRLWLIGAIAYLAGASFLSRARIIGAVTVIGGSGYQYALELSETGINMESFEVRYYPAVNEKLAGPTGEPVVRAVSAQFSRDITYSGEVKGATGVMAFTLAVALTFANDIATFGTTPGSILLDEVTETQVRTGYRAVAGRASSDPLCIAT